MACFEAINHQLLMLDRQRVGREANPSAAVLDNFEADIASAEAFLYAASVMLLTRRLARSENWPGHELSFESGS